MPAPLIRNHETVFTPAVMPLIVNRETVFAISSPLPIILNKETVFTPSFTPPPPPPQPPPVSNAVNPDQAVSVSVNTGAFYFHTFGRRLTAGWAGENLSVLTWNDLFPFTWDNIANTYPTWASMGGTETPTEFIASQEGFVYRSFYDLSDDGIPIVMVWEFPPRLLSGVRNQNEFDSIESTFETPPGSADPVFVDAGVTETTAEAGGPTYTEVGQHDTRISFAQVLSWSGPSPLRGRFMNVRYRCTSMTPVRFKGAIAYVTSEERES